MYFFLFLYFVPEGKSQLYFAAEKDDAEANGDEKTWKIGNKKEKISQSGKTRSQRIMESTPVEGQ